MHDHLVKAQDRATVNYKLAARLDAVVSKQSCLQTPSGLPLVRTTAADELRVQGTNATT